MMRANRLFSKLAAEGLETGEVCLDEVRRSFHIIALNRQRKRKMIITVLLFLIVTFLSTTAVTYFSLIPVFAPDKRPLLEHEESGIMELVINNDCSRLERLLERYRYRDVTDDYGWTPLHWAVFLNLHQAVHLLTKSGASWDTASTRPWFKFPAGTTPGDILLLKYSSLIFNLTDMASI